MSTIDYARAKREHPKMKAMLTRAIKSGDPQKVVDACKRAVEAWATWGAWPDDWHRWNIALGDAYFSAQRKGVTLDPNGPAFSLDDL